MSRFIELLQVLLIGLKLTNRIDWPWLWVLAPTWLTLGVGALILLMMAVWALVLWVVRKAL